MTAVSNYGASSCSTSPLTSTGLHGERSRSTAAPGPLPLPGVIDNETTVALNLYAEALDPWDREALVAVDALAQVVAEAIRNAGVVPGAPVLA